MVAPTRKGLDLDGKRLIRPAPWWTGMTRRFSNHFSALAAQPDSGRHGQALFCSPRNFRLHVGSRCVRGNHRATNEDRCYADVDRGIFVMVDGMGGHRGGAEASRIIMEAVPAELMRTLPARMAKPKVFQRTVEDAIVIARQQMAEVAANQPKYFKMGATLAAAVFADDVAYVTHVGDCRVYHVHAGRIGRVTSDQTYAQVLVDAGVISPAQARTHKYRHVVTNYVGVKALDERPTFHAVTLVPGDRLLLATDGLTGSLDDNSVSRIIGDAESAQGAADELVLAALKHGSKDNIACIVVNVLRKL